MTMLGAKVLVCLAVLALALPVPQACTHTHTCTLHSLHNVKANSAALLPLNSYFKGDPK